MPLAYIPKSLANTAPLQTITSIFLCAGAPGPILPPTDSGFSANAKLTNHWVMHLAISSTSIRFDPSPTGPGNSLDLIIISNEHAQPVNAAKIVSVTLVPNLTVGHTLDRITNAKYDKYSFIAGGQGCRFWLHSVLALLHLAGYITDEAGVKAAIDALDVVSTEQGNPVPAIQQTHMAMGIFYSSR